MDPAMPAQPLPAVSPIARYDRPVSQALAAALDKAMQAVAEVRALASAPTVPGFEAALRRVEALASGRLAGKTLSEWRLREGVLKGSQLAPPVRLLQGLMHAHDLARTHGQADGPLDARLLAELHRHVLALPTPSPIRGEAEAAVADVSAILARTDLPVLLQMAIAHGRLCCVRPFDEMAGAASRALLHAAIARRGTPGAWPLPISVGLMRERKAYAAGVASFARGDVDGWCRVFLLAVAVAARAACELHADMARLQGAWASDVGPRRPHSAIAKVLALLPFEPVLDVPGTAARLGVSEEGARRALNELELRGVLSTLVVGARYDRTREARGLVDLVDGLDGTRAWRTRPGQPDMPPSTTSTWPVM